MLTELETRNREGARLDLVKAIWQGAEPVKLLELASAAGMAGGEADALIARIGQAKEQLAHIEQLPRLRKDADAADGRFEKVQKHASEETARLDAEVDEASYAASNARRAVYAAEASARQLLALHDEGLLLGAMPKEVARLIDRRDAEERFRQADRARVEAFDARNYWRTAVANAQERLATMPILPPVERDYHQDALKERLKEARRQLAEAESRLKKAEAAAEATRKAIP